MVDIRDDMITIESDLREAKMEISYLSDREYWNKRKVIPFKRKAAGKTYSSPRIVLGSQYKDFVGKYFSIFVGKAEYKLEFQGKMERFRGDCMLLFFRDDWNKEKDSK